MELVQWIVPGADGVLRVGWAPAWADRLPSLGPELRPVRRRGAPLVSRWLAHPLSIGALEEGAGLREEARVIVPVGALSLRFVIALDAPDAAEARSPLPADADDVRFAGVFSELVRVVADLCECAGLPPTAIAPLAERSGLEVAVAPVQGAVGSVSIDALADSVILARVAVELCAHARGLKLVDARVRCGDQSAAADGRTRAFIGGALASQEKR